MNSRKLFMILICGATLMSPVVVRAQRQVEIPQDVVKQIRQRPKRIPAKPLNVMFKDIVAELDNQPDVDLRPKISQMGISIRSQGDRGTCSVFALTFLLEYMYAWRENYHNPDFSEEYLNYASNLAIGQYDDGGFFDALDLGYQKYGIVNESLAPYHSSYNPPYVAPPRLMRIGEGIEPRFKAHFIKPWNNQTGLTASELKDIEQALNGERPVATGVRWPNNFQTETIHGIELMKTPPPSGVFDGHSIDLVGYKASRLFPGGGYFIFRNSWGTSFGTKGYGFMSFEYANKYANDAVDYFKPGA